MNEVFFVQRICYFLDCFQKSVLHMASSALGKLSPENSLQPIGSYFNVTVLKVIPTDKINHVLLSTEMVRNVATCSRVPWNVSDEAEVEVVAVVVVVTVALA